MDGLISSLEQHDIGKDGNVHAELGSLWRSFMTDPEQAARVLGELLVHVGEDRILWGTDCIWYGSPQDQLQAFRAFEITEELQEKHGYPALTPERKAKILGATRPGPMASSTAWPGSRAAAPMSAASCGSARRCRPSISSAWPGRWASPPIGSRSRPCSPAAALAPASPTAASPGSRLRPAIGQAPP